MSIREQADRCDFLEVGAFTYGQPLIIRTWRGIFPKSNKVKIGKFCSIADNVVVFMGGNHRVDWISTYPFPTFDWPGTADRKGMVPTNKGDIIIGNDVWVGSHATIMSGVVIGDGAVIGAMAVVASDIPPYTVAVGNPAKAVKKRFDDETIEKLLAMAWWDWPLVRIQKASAILSSSNTQALFDFYESMLNENSVD